MLSLSPINEHAVSHLDAERVGLAWILVGGGGARVLGLLAFGRCRRSNGGGRGLDQAADKCLCEAIHLLLLRAKQLLCGPGFVFCVLADLDGVQLWRIRNSRS